MDINKNTIKPSSLGHSVYAKLLQNRKNETIQIIFTKGKLELIVKEINRINVYDDSMNIFYKDNRNQFINLINVTYME